MRGRCLVVAVVLALAGCGEPSSGPTSTMAPVEQTTPAAEGHLARCLPAIEPGEARAEVLAPAPGVRLPAAVWGDGGGTVVVLLHQTDRDGLCAWTPYARHVVRAGLTAVAFDMCGWAGAECPASWDARASDQVQHAVVHAREVLGARRVVVVGASLGAARTILALADGVDADGWVALSPPLAWDGQVVARRAAEVDRPGLVLHDPDDGDAEYAAARRAADRAGARFVRARGGHGYDILWNVDGSLTRLGRQVLAHAAGVS